MKKVLFTCLIISLGLPLLSAQISNRLLTTDSIGFGFGITAMTYRIPNSFVSMNFKYPNMKLGLRIPANSNLAGPIVESSFYSRSSIVSIAGGLSISNDFSDDLFPKPIAFVNIYYYYKFQLLRNSNKYVHLAPSFGIGTIFCQDMNTPLTSSVGLQLNYQNFSFHYCLHSFTRSGAAILEAARLDNPSDIPREYLIEVSISCRIIALINKRIGS
jgi:hypothetical protein